MKSKGSQAANRLGRRAGLLDSIPLTLMSSSRSGQCTPWPSPRIRKFCRSALVASDKRQDQISGTEIHRPSINWAIISSSVTWMALSLGSTGSSAVFMPCLNYLCLMGLNQFFDCGQFDSRKSAITGKANRRKPEFGQSFVSLNMNMSMGGIPVTVYSIQAVGG